MAEPDTPMREIYVQPGESHLCPSLPYCAPCLAPAWELRFWFPGWASARFAIP